jgi:uncharacterized protein (DUF433 family)
MCAATPTSDWRWLMGGQQPIPRPDDLFEKLEAGWTILRLQRHCNVSRDVVKRWVRELGYRRHLDGPPEDMAEKVAAGWTIEQLCAHYRRGNRVVTRWRRELGYQGRLGSATTNHRRDVTVEEVCRLYEQGLSGELIAKRFECSPMTVYRRLYESGVQLRPGGWPPGQAARNYDGSGTCPSGHPWATNTYIIPSGVHSGRRVCLTCKAASHQRWKKRRKA